jgi:hypothetical protein
MLGSMPTSALLERIEKHIDRLDQALKDSEDLLSSLKRPDRDEWILELHERLAVATRPVHADDERGPEQPAKPYYRS